MDQKCLLLFRTIEESIKTLNKQVSTISIIINQNWKADKIVARGIRLRSKRLSIEKYINSRSNILYRNCAR